MSYQKMVISEYKDEQHSGRDEDHDTLWEQRGSGVPNLSHEPTSTTKNRIKAYAEDRQRKLLNIVMKLALVRGYNDHGHIKLQDGSYMPKTDVGTLLLNALAREKPVQGISEFVDLLREAGVSPTWITNENVRQKLEGRQRKHNTTTQYTDQYYADPFDSETAVIPPRETTPVVMSVLPSARKRSRTEFEQNPDEDCISKRKTAIPRKKRRTELELLTQDVPLQLLNAMRTPLPYDDSSEDEQEE